MAPSDQLFPTSGFLFTKGQIAGAGGWECNPAAPLRLNNGIAYRNFISPICLMFLDGAAVPDPGMTTCAPLDPHIAFSVGGMADSGVGAQGLIRVGSSPSPAAVQSTTYLNFGIYKNPASYSETPNPPQNFAASAEWPINFIAPFRYVVFARPTLSYDIDSNGLLVESGMSPPWRAGMVPLACWDFGDEYEMLPDADGSAWGCLSGIFASIDHGTPKVVAGATPAGYPAASVWVGNTAGQYYPESIGRIRRMPRLPIQAAANGAITYPDAITNEGAGFELSSNIAGLPRMNARAGVVTTRGSGPVVGIELDSSLFRARRVRIGVHDATEVSQSWDSEDLFEQALDLDLAGDKITRIAMPRPALLKGLPHQPLVGITQAPSTSYVLTGAGHVQLIDVVAASDPLYDTDAGRWITPPPAGGAGDYRWTTRQTDWPSPLPTLSTVGLTQPGELRHPNFARWPSAPGPGTPAGAQAWTARYPCRPSLVNYVHYRGDAEPVPVGLGISMRADQAEHLWSNQFVDITPPLTWIMVAVVTRYPGVFDHPDATFLDEGRDFAIDVPSPPLPLTERIPLPTEQIATERISMGLDPDQLAIQASWPGDDFAADQTPNRLATQQVTNSRPSVYAGVWNGQRSVVATWSASGGRHLRIGTASYAPGPRSSWLLGRRNGALDPESGALDAVLFEVRVWDSALNIPQLDAQAKQLLAAWRSDAFG